MEVHIHLKDYLKFVKRSAKWLKETRNARRDGANRVGKFGKQIIVNLTPKWTGELKDSIGWRVESFGSLLMFYASTPYAREVAFGEGLPRQAFVYKSGTGNSLTDWIYSVEKGIVPWRRAVVGTPITTPFVPELRFKGVKKKVTIRHYTPFLDIGLDKIKPYAPRIMKGSQLDLMKRVGIGKIK